MVLIDVETTRMRRLGIDERRYRSVRWFRTDQASWRRFEPWMTTLVDLDTGEVLGIVDGRDSGAVGDWLAQRSKARRERIEIAAIGPSAAFRKALRGYLPRAAVSVDKFHLVKLGSDMVTTVRQRLARTHHGRRYRKDDQAWDERMRMGYYCQIANMPEATKLYDTVVAWWDAIEVLIVTGATTARVGAANSGTKNIKRTCRGFRNPENYRMHILLTSAARTVT